MSGNSVSLLTISPSSFVFSPCLAADRHHVTGHYLRLVSKDPSSVLSLHFKNAPFLPSPPVIPHAPFDFLHVSIKRWDLWCLYAQTRRSRGGGAVMEISDFDEDEFEDFGSDEEVHDGGDAEDEVEEIFMPVEKMRKWFANKPRGFGEGKVYDTSVEDKLLEEIERSRRAQAANLNNLKNNPPKAVTSKIEVAKNKVPEVVPGGVRVHVVNLPKKKNIHRDLELAFKGVRGVVNIHPSVAGNKKTKDPICKGFAFVDFKCEADAARFVQLFSGQSIKFGRIEKEIRCKMAKSQASIFSRGESGGTIDSTRFVMHPTLEADLKADSDRDDPLFEGTAIEELEEPDDELITSEIEEVSLDMESFSFSVEECSDDDRVDSTVKPVTIPSSLKKHHKNGIDKERMNASGKKGKGSKLHVPSSAKRLRVKEKTLLTEVFIKYASQTASTSIEEK
ncbi:hypothetical protein K2173_003221 [Erythroxylum novogranatense]|uniref:RRM domain-containing protein n=1 Tax=Erythroxylum novogranatense TaxID=1862640 RepID=A0AAV8SXE9_9ROSI|nr:hypothetical protein K2173_003221 [Erythroxylum novogranatense]